MLTELKKIISKEIKKNNKNISKKTIKKYDYVFKNKKIFDKLSY